MKKDFHSIVAALFYGEVDESVVFPFPDFNDEEKQTGKEFINAIRNFAKTHVDSGKFDQEGLFPDEYIKAIGELGLYGLCIPEEYGGIGLKNGLYGRLCQEISGFDASTSVFLGGHQSIGYRALLNEGTKEQKEKWLPDLATGKKLAAFCLTEPGAGSDAYSMVTKAHDNGDGTFSITGQKLWITNAGRADFYCVFCKTDHDIRGKRVEKVTCFIVEKGASGAEGLSFGEKEDKMGIRASETRAVYFDKVVVPESNIIGEKGKGFKIAMTVLNSGRLSLGAGVIGGMKTILELATKHARERVQFGRSISEFGLIQRKLSFMASETYAAESVVYFTTGLVDRGMEEYQLESAICKVFCSEALWSVVDTGLQIAAGNGYMREYPYERMLRDSRINLIFEGTNEILRVFVALAGVKAPAESLKELGKISDLSQVLKEPIKSLGLLTDFATGRIKKMIGIGGHLSKVHESLTDEASVFSSLLGQFSLQVENTLIKHGKKIIGNEYPQERLANMVIFLFVMLAMLSRTTKVLSGDEDENKKRYVKLLFNESFHRVRHKFMANLKSMNKNFDDETRELSKLVCNGNGYGLDIIDD